MKTMIFMFGKTGMGKSTSILYLAGEEMQVVKNGHNNHIDAKRPLKNRALESVTSSGLSKSETSCINVVTILN